MNFSATRQRVLNRGIPPVEFLAELVQWGNTAPEEIFAPNPNPEDIYAVIRPELGPWTLPIERRAAMLEAMRVHAGFESGWNWSEGVDKTNATSMANKTGQEAGAWQVSFDSEHLGHDALRPFAVAHGIDTVNNFIANMKSDHPLAMEYYARLVRVNIRWAGPLLRREINPWLRRAAMAEFQSLLA